MHRRLSRLAVLLALILAPVAAWTQGEDEQATLNGWSATLSQAEATLGRADLAAADLDALRREVQAVYDEARAFDEDLQPRISEITDRLASIAPPEGGEGKEAPVLVETRQHLQAELERLTGFSQQAGLVVLNAHQLLDKIRARRDTQFTTALFAHDRSALSPGLIADLAVETPTMLVGLGRIIGDWGRLVAASSDTVTVLLVVVAILIVVVILIARALFLKWAQGPGSSGEPTRSQKTVMALAIVAVDIGAPVLILFGLRALLFELKLLPRSIGEIFDGLTVAVAVFTVITGLARALAAPNRPSWRIAGIADQTARQSYGVVVIAAAILALYALIASLAGVAAAPSFYATGMGGVLSIPTSILALVATRMLVRGRDALSTEERQRSARWRILTPLAGLAALVTIVAAVAGYLAFASFMIAQIAWVWVVVGAYVLASALVDLLLTSTLSADHPAGQRLARNLGMSDRALNQSGVVFTGVAKLILAFVTALLIAAPWGFDSSTITSRLEGLYYGIHVGSIRITFSTILTVAIIFVGVVALTRIFQRWLDHRFLPTTAIEPGLKNSIRITAGYVGVILAAILAATYAGFDLASIAIVAGALSVGIGFGLQSIVNNFVSGLILLAERPIRAGDWIEVGSDQGTVRRISVRATEIETFDRASVIIPNSNLISGVVTNRYLRGNIGRVAIPVGVSYDSDPQRVKEILLTCADRNEFVLKSPVPFVLFMDFGSSSLDFELRCYLADISNGLTVRSDLRFAILAGLREAGIEIPFPQQDVHLRDLPEIERTFARAAGNKPDADAGTSR
jgi:potassium-dependent mechanosensitive channel